MGSLTKALEQKEAADLRPEVSAAKEDLLKGNTKRLNCDVPASLYKKLHLIAVQNETSISALVNVWIADYIAEQNKKASSSAKNSTEL
jgi:hypothetical protein